MRIFCISNGEYSIVLDETDVLDIIGALLSEVSQMNTGDSVVVTCYDDSGKEGVNKYTES